MSADILNIRDYQSKKAIERAHAELEKHAVEIANAAFPCVFTETMSFTHTVPYGGAGIDGMDCSQANAFHAPENDPA